METKLYTGKRVGSGPGRQEIEQTVMKQVEAVAKERAQGLTLDSNIVELGLDSLERMDVIGRIGEIYSLQVPESVLPEIETCREISEAVLERLQFTGPEDDIPLKSFQFEEMPEYRQLKTQIVAAAAEGEANPFFAVHDGVSNNLTRIDGRELINFSGNNYLGMSGDPGVTQAGKAALDMYGTSISASRLASGTRPLHNELEKDLADVIGAEDSVTFTSGHSTNATVIGHLMSRGDLIVHDERVRNSIITGALLSGADRRSFLHNDWELLNEILNRVRRNYRRVLVVIEGVYSMEGDYPDVPRFVEVKNRHVAWLMIDEAHSIGTMGRGGRGMVQFFDIESREIEIWMGTLSKAFGACGCYVAGSRPLIEYLKFTCPGAIFTIGLSPASAAAARYVIQHLQDDRDRFSALHSPCRVLSLPLRATRFRYGCLSEHAHRTGDAR